MTLEAVLIVSCLLKVYMTFKKSIWEMTLILM